MLSFEMTSPGFSRPLTVLIDCGASENYARRQTMALHKPLLAEATAASNEHDVVRVKMADGKIAIAPRVLVTLPTVVGTFASNETYYVIDLDDRWDLILGMGWLEEHQPWIHWKSKKMYKHLREALRASIGVKSNELTPTKAVAPFTTQNPFSALSVLDDDADINDGVVDSAEVLADRTEVFPVRSGEDSTTSDVVDQGSVDPFEEFLPAKGSAEDAAVHSIDDETRQNTLKNVLSTRKLSRFGLMRKRVFQLARRREPVPSRHTSRFRKRSFPSYQHEDRGFVDPRSAISGRVKVEDLVLSHCDLEELPTSAEEIVKLEEMSFSAFAGVLRRQEVLAVAVIHSVEEVELSTSSTLDREVDVEHVANPSKATWDGLKYNPYFELIEEFRDVFPDEVPGTLPPDKGVRHEIDLVSGTKWCVTRQWPLPKEQVDHIDAFFAKQEKAGHDRPSTSPHSSPTFCVKKATGGWRIVHAFNRLNAATIPAQTPIPRRMLS